MINWEKSAKLNNTTINLLKLYFDKRSGSHKKVVRVCDECRNEKIMMFKEYRDLCKTCKMASPETRIKMSKNHADFNGENNPMYGLKGKDSPIYGDKNIMYGKHHSDEIKHKCGNGGRGRIQTEEEKEKRRISNKLSMTKILKNKLSELNSGKNNYWYGKQLTLNHRISLSCSHLNINKSEWIKFSKDHPYPIEFHQLKEQIRNKYNNCDYISGLHKDICNKSKNLDVHHIDYNKQNSNINNFVPLSKSNHTITGNNRLFWNRLFTYSLQYEAEYYGDDLICQ